jgi:hypothetical protein
MASGELSFIKDLKADKSHFFFSAGGKSPGGCKVPSG